MRISELTKNKHTLYIIILTLLVYFSICQSLAFAVERDFEEEEKKLINAAIQFIKDNEDPCNPTDADEDLANMLKTDAADGMKQLRRETKWLLGEGITTKSRISIGLPDANGIKTDIKDIDGFDQVKTLAQTLYHEWVHHKQIETHNKNSLYAVEQNWASCQPMWIEIEAYYKEIQIKLQWQLAREERLKEISESGSLTPEQLDEALRLDQEIASLEQQIDDLLDTLELKWSTRLESKSYRDKCKTDANDYKCKTYEDSGNHLKDGFDEKTTQEKYDEITKRLNDISLIDPDQTKQTITEKIAGRAADFDSKKMENEEAAVPQEGGESYVMIPNSEYEDFFRLTAHEGTLYSPTEITITHIDPNFMAPWQAMGYNILSSVYCVSVPNEAMANPDYPATVTMSYNKELVNKPDFHIFYMRAESMPRQGRLLWELLPGELIDYESGTITADCSHPFSLYVIVETGLSIIDDFENYISDYNDNDNMIWDTWANTDVNTNGSQVGYSDYPFMETEIVHSGRQAMPLFYGISDEPVTESIATVTFDPPIDFNDYDTMSMWIYGDPNNDGNGQFFVKINDQKVYLEVDLTEPAWQEVNIDLYSLDTYIGNTVSMSIGVDGTNVSGLVFIDNISAYNSEFPELGVLMVDNFEDYTSSLNYKTWIWETWLGGIEDPCNGSIIDILPETEIVHSGRQSMPFYYNNTEGVTYSVAFRTFEIPIDWPVYDFFSLWIYGDPNNTGDGQFYIGFNDQKVYLDVDLKKDEWQEVIYSLESQPSGEPLWTETFFFGIENQDAAGVIFIDDIALFELSE